ncbi:MAG: CRISPR-associated protein Csm3 [Candidatus Marinimicrobia bacterium]|nr:CRISPR-associated protein Csm3 [Candidatus Neomarinimicrobiota bacterium]
MKLEKKIFIKGNILAVTGLHIGGSNQGMSIGGVDNSVIRDPITLVPYIPGSSLKGKMRSLLEKQLGHMSYDEKNDFYGPCDCGECIICKIFGTSANKAKESGRLIVRDAFMNESSRLELEQNTNMDMPFTEVKTEASIDRIKSKANPRQLERVPAGTTFQFELVLDIYNGDDEKEFLDYIEQALHLVEDDYLGGGGSRGSGQVRIEWDEVKKTYKDRDAYEKDNQEKMLEA